MKTPTTLKYSKTHEWVREMDDGIIEIGITDFAQSELGSLVFVNLPEEGDEVESGEAFGDVESVKAVSDVISPVSGVVVEVNEVLLDHPEMINDSPYEAWMIRVSDITDEDELLDAEAYDLFCETEGS
ncbi:MAG: glycine cleavage system protein GcvH [Clostridiaceae bacterium]|jgi:glycine cleavage system H protein|nr:glycine cleavage system protein GcvH [Clostridiaceae bacterium]